MEHKISQYSSSYNGESQLFKELIEEFIGNYSSTKQDEAEKFLDFFYKECQKNNLLFCPHKQIQLYMLKLSHVMKIQEQVILMNQLEIKDSTSHLNFLYQFCMFLNQKEVTKIYYILPKKHRISKKSESPLITKFEIFLNLKNYSLATIRCTLVNIKSFLKFSNYSIEILPSNDYWLTCFKQYEEHLNKKALLENILFCSVYEYLKAVRLFSIFLYEKKEILFKYDIPSNMII